MNGRKRKWSVLQRRGGRPFNVGGMAMWWCRMPGSFEETWCLLYERSSGNFGVIGEAGQIRRRWTGGIESLDGMELTGTMLPGWYTSAGWFSRRCEAKRAVERRALKGVLEQAKASAREWAEWSQVVLSAACAVVGESR